MENTKDVQATAKTTTALPQEIASVERPAVGEAICGDGHLIIDEAATTIAVVDGLGHGEEAAKASSVFIDFVRHQKGKPINEILAESTGAMSQTRGAAAALIRIDRDNQTMSFCGVGNVEIKARSRDRICPISMPGILGRRLRKLVVFEYDLHPGDLLVAHTDGISSRFEIEEYADLAPKAMARKILQEHGKAHDDATCVVLSFN